MRLRRLGRRCRRRSWRRRPPTSVAVPGQPAGRCQQAGPEAEHRPNGKAPGSNPRCFRHIRRRRGPGYGGVRHRFTARRLLIRRAGCPDAGGRRNDAYLTTRPKKTRCPACPTRQTSSPAPPGRQGYRIWILVNWDRMLMRNPSSQPARLGWARIPPGRLPTGPNLAFSTRAGIGFSAPPRMPTPQRPRPTQRPSLTAGGRQFSIPQLY